MSKYRRYFFLLLYLILVLVTGGCGSTSQLPQTQLDELAGDISASATLTLSVTEVPSTLTPSPVPIQATNTALPPTKTNTVVPKSTRTPTEVPISPTPTEDPPMATLFGLTICRSGPGTVYPAVARFSTSGSAPVRGRMDDSSWYLIELSESGETCWIFNEIIELDKSAANMPVLTPPPSPTPAPAPTQSEEQKALGVKYYLIIPDNGGPFACGDGLAYFYSGKKGKDTEDKITVALNALFSVKSEFVGNYYNPIYESGLRVKDVEVENGHATIWLGGKFVKPKNECEAKRIHLQVWETANQFSDVTHRPIIFVNNALLGDLLRAVQK